MALAQTPGAGAPVSVVGNDGKVLLVPVMPGNQFYMQAPSNAPDALGSLCAALLQVPHPGDHQWHKFHPHLQQCNWRD